MSLEELKTRDTKRKGYFIQEVKLSSFLKPTKILNIKLYFGIGKNNASTLKQ